MFFFCITLSPSSPGEPGGPEGPGSPCNNKTSRCFFNSGTHQQKTHTPFTHTTKQLTLCPFSPGSPARPSNPRSPCGAKKEKLHTFFVRKHTFKKNSTMKCGAAKCVMNVADEVPWVQTVLACPWRRQIQDDPVKITTVT